MKRDCIIQGKIFRTIDDKGYYLISRDGEIFSTRKKCLLKHSLDHDGYHRVDLFGKHCKVHRLVYQTWVEDIPQGAQINHLNDNKDDNSVDNLYIGTQKQNIADAKRNGHRIGRCYYLTVFDKRYNRVMTFCPAKDFYDYDSEHTQKNGGIVKSIPTNWFKKRYDLIEYKKIANLEQFLELKGVSTMGDECNLVGQI